ncbi:TetR/AcrR family transcriptional regulator C-terminal domain-containing protein [Saccharopolyspora erythraea]|uniref:TetR/AcrR family transcriptional regulator C-terminal domain-containing protein n=1 Tax=Saccharopolyspora erythraea TaxID=1836 RepID=UPI001BAB01E3|nr:TetR/AcrR family transcriptional regulator C-terminal domain-containing protein [Saccharopolyspora erythraea]QUH04408.1 TetR/AcrR family transcriptional regulator C-terminal domain-containing protein [Saccharopolyspora erythraea]
MNKADPPYLAIAARIRARIASGELRPDDRVPSARRISREHGVAIATATKVLAELRRQGLVRAVPGVGTVVVGVPRDAQGETGAMPDRMVRVAIGIADAEGLDAVSMRRIATELGVATMTLYRHVRSKGDLVLRMADAAFGESPLPEVVPPGWRARLEVSARLQWALYRRHPWLPGAISFARPRPMPNVMLHVEWVVRALDGLGLDRSTLLYTYVTLFNHVRGTALNLRPDAEALRDTGMSADEWMDAHGGPELRSVLDPERYPVFVALTEQDWDFDFDTLFEQGLRQLLDGLEARLTG